MNLGLGFLKIAAQNGLGEGHSFWLPRQGQALAANTDNLFYFIYYLCVFFFVLIISAMVYFAVKYRRKDANQRTSNIKGSHRLEIIWSVIPGILLLVIFGWGFRDWMHIVVPPANYLEVRVTGQKWNWSFDYVKDGINSPNLVVPVGHPIKLVMSSKDVSHSFFIPDMRIKRDVLPNRYTVEWFEPNEIGEHHVFCTQYCGTSHSGMLTKVRVLSEQDYADWIAAGGDLGGAGVPLAKLGELVFNSKGCTACHNIDGTAKIGPALNGIYGTKVELADGSSVEVDDNYIRESIMVPAAKVVKGFAPVMPSFQGQLNDKQTNGLIEYIKSLK